MASSISATLSDRGMQAYDKSNIYLSKFGYRVLIGKSSTNKEVCATFSHRVSYSVNFCSLEQKPGQRTSVQSTNEGGSPFHCPYDVIIMTSMAKLRFSYMTKRRYMTSGSNSNYSSVLGNSNF